MADKLKGFAIPAALAGISVLAHFKLYPHSLALLNADYAFFSLEADRFQAGDWSAFYVSQDYGGTLMAFFRAAFHAVWDGLRLGGWAAGHLAFSFLVLPAVFAALAYLLVRAYCSFGAALFVGLISAVGYHFWLDHYSNDFYPAYLLLGFLILIARAPFSSPLIEAPLVRLFLGSFLCGLAVYTSRSALMYAAVFFLPPRGVLVGWAQWIFTARNQVDRILFGLAGFLFALFLYIEAFGPDFGALPDGRHLRLHAGPNLRLAILLSVIPFLRTEWRVLLGLPWKRLTIAALGLFLGFLPEFLFWAGKGSLPPAGAGQANGFAVFFQLVGMLPATFTTLVAGDDGVGRSATLALLVVSLVGLFRVSWKNSRLFPIGVLAVLAVYSYCRIHTYTLGPVRYLYPIFPALLVALGVAFDQARGRRWVLALMGILALGQMGHHYGSRERLISKIEQSGLNEETRQIVSVFESAGVDLVYADDYWQTNQHTLASEKKVTFFHTSGLIPRMVREKMKAAEDRVGVLVSSPERVPASGEMGFLDRTWKLQPLGRVGERVLFLAEQR